MTVWIRRLLKTTLFFGLLVATVWLVSTTETQGQSQVSPEQPTNAEVYHFTLGSFNAIVVSDGTLATPPFPNYAPTAEPAELERSLVERFLSPDELGLYFNALYVDTGNHKVLVDTGSGVELGDTLGRLATNLRDAGIEPETIDTVILTHAHPDHIGGIVSPAGDLIFANAHYYISQPEWSFWTAPTVDLSSLKLEDGFKTLIVAAAQKHLGAITTRVTQFQPNQEIIPGFRAIAAPGHTPGQSAVWITSEDEQLLLTADVFFNEAFDLEHPQWQTGFDYDPNQAIATRRRILDQVADGRTLVIAYHMPFPALGHIRSQSTASGTAQPIRYEWEPLPWQF